jgi:hypothetical protein
MKTEALTELQQPFDASQPSQPSQPTTTKSSHSHISVRSDVVKLEGLDGVKVEPLSTNKQQFQPAIVLFKIENPNNTADEIEPQQVEKGLEGQTLNVIFKINDETIQQPSFSSLTSSIKQVESIKVEPTTSHVSTRRSRLRLFWRKHLVSRHQSRQRAPKRIIQSKRAKAKQRLIQYKETIKSCSQSQVEAVEISPPHVAETSLPIKR